VYIKYSVDEKLLLLLEFSVALFAGWRLDVRAARASELSVNFHLSTVSCVVPGELLKEEYVKSARSIKDQ
jgi:hypothetical protein